MNPFKYFLERAKWIKFGKPYRNIEEKHRIFNICYLCDNFIKNSEDDGSCSICGCGIKKNSNFLNKIAWGTTRCPLSEPKWTEDKEEYKNLSEINIEDLQNAEKEHFIEIQEQNAPKPCSCKG